MNLPYCIRYETRLTESGRKSGNSSLTSTFAYFDGNIDAKGVDGFVCSDGIVSFSRGTSCPAEGHGGGGISSASNFVTE